VFRELSEVFPGARFLFCARDPRAVTASLLQMADRARGKGFHVSPLARGVRAAIRAVKAHNMAGSDAAKLCNRVPAVVYERLAADPEEETKRICNLSATDAVDRFVVVLLRCTSALRFWPWWVSLRCSIRLLLILLLAIRSLRRGVPGSTVPKYLHFAPGDPTSTPRNDVYAGGKVSL
jgi:hypothetical protein